MMRKTKLYRIILILFICTISITGCSNPPPLDSDNTTLATGEDPTEETTTEILTADVPDSDFEGHVFTVINIDYSIPIWTQRDIYSEGQNGDIINDSVYMRNTAVEDKFNCTIASMQVLDTIAELNKFISSGDSTVDFATVPLNRFSIIANTGGLVEYSNIPYINLDAPWWDSSSVASLSVANKLFAACSDITIMDKDATTGMVFNKKLADDYAISNIYDTVLKGEWTIDKLIELSKIVATDVDGNDVQDDKDIYGLLYQRDTMSSFLSGCGGFVADKDDDDLPIMTLYTPKNIDILDKLYDFLYNPQDCFHVMKFFDPKPEGFTDGMTRMFQNNQALFMWIRMADVENLRAMDTDFGILPIPKLDTLQETHLQTVNPYVGTVVIVPQSASDLERIGIMLESLSAESRRILLPAYYDIMLTNKLTRDEESLDMLDIIFDNRVYDVGDIYNFGDIAGQLIYMTMTYDRNMASKYESLEKSINAAIEKLVTAYTELQ